MSTGRSPWTSRPGRQTCSRSRKAAARPGWKETLNRLMAAQERGLLESLVGHIKGRAWLDSVPYPPHQIAEDLWTIEGWRVKPAPGLVFPCRSTVVRLNSGGVVLLAAPPFA